MINRRAICGGCNASSDWHSNSFLPGGWIQLTIDASTGHREVELHLCRECSEKIKVFLGRSQAIVKSGASDKSTVEQSPLIHETKRLSK